MSKICSSSTFNLALPTPAQIQNTIPGKVGVTSQNQGWRNIVFNEMIFSREIKQGEGTVAATKLHRMGLMYQGRIKGESSINRGKWRKSTLAAGDLYMLPAEHEAEWMWSTIGRERLRYLGFHFSPELLRETIENVFDKEPDTFEFTTDLQWRDSVLSQLISSIYIELRQNRQVDPLYIETVSHFLSAQIVHHLSQKKLLSDSGKKGLTPKLLKRVVDYIEDSLSQRITIAELAAHANMSVYHFVRMFKVATGVTPHQYIIYQRMQRADQLLNQTDFSITQIGIEVGYDVAGNFSAAYKKYRGVSPKTYRLAKAQGQH